MGKRLVLRKGIQARRLEYIYSICGRATRRNKKKRLVAFLFLFLPDLRSVSALENANDTSGNN